MSRIYVTPAAGKTFRDPLNPSVQFPAEGDWREDLPAYHRLRRSGDATITAGPAAAPSEPAAPKTVKK